MTPPDDWEVVETALTTCRVVDDRNRGFLSLARLRERDHELLNTQEVFAKEIARLREREAPLERSRDSWMWERNKELSRAEAAEARVARLEEALREAGRAHSVQGVRRIVRRALDAKEEA